MALCKEDMVSYKVLYGEIEYQAGSYGFEFERMSSTSFIVNRNKLQISMLAYNFNNWFRRLCMAKDVQSFRMETIRTKIIKIAAKVTRHARKVTRNSTILEAKSTSYPPDKWLQLDKRCQDIFVKGEIMRGIIHIFPFEKVKRGSTVAIFGLGIVGQEYIAQVRTREFCNIKYIIDNNSGESEFLGIRVVDIQGFIEKKGEVDKIVIANGSLENTLDIIKELEANGLSKDGIIYDDRTSILSKKCLEDIMGDALSDVDYLVDRLSIVQEDCLTLQTIIRRHNNVVSRIPYGIINEIREEEFDELRSKFCNSNKQNMLDTTRLVMLYQNIIRVMQSVSGNVAEVGVYKGDTASILAHFCRKYNRQLYLFDTFNGFSEKDLVGVDEEKKDYFSDVSFQKVKDFVGTDDNIQYIRGYFPESITTESEQSQYCLVHIDCDLYKPIKSALVFFWERLNMGGIVIVHDYSSKCWAGATQAVDEFCKEKKIVQILIPDMAGTVILVKQ